MSNSPSTRWSPGIFLPGEHNASSPSPSPSSPPQYALLILNQPLLSNTTLFNHLWSNATYRVCADGGANRLYDHFSTTTTTNQAHNYIPTAIVGDLDSIRNDVCTFYKNKHNVPLSQDCDLYATDFSKCLKYIFQLHHHLVHSSPQQPDDTSSPHTPADNTPQLPLPIIAINATGGRIDQSFHTFHQLHLANAQNRRHLYLINNECITFLLSPGHNMIDTPLHLFGETCGIIPLDGVTRVTLRGFRWDLEGEETRFGGMVSTSNHLVGDVVEVWGDKVLVFTMEIRKEGGHG